METIENQLSILTPPGFDPATLRPMSPIVWHDLGMDAICDAMATKEDHRSVLRMVMMNLTDDPKVAAFRGAVFEDILRNPSLRVKIMALLEQVDDLQGYMSTKRNIDKNDGIWTLTRRLKEVNDYIRCIESLEQCLAEADLHSEGLLNLKAYIHQIQSDCAFAELKQDISGLYLETNKLKSVTLGINLNENYEAESMGVISLNSKPFKQANVLSAFSQRLARQDQIQPGNDWNGSMAFQPVSGGITKNAGTFTKTMLLFSALTFNPLVGIGIGLAHVRKQSTEEHVMEPLDQVANRMLSTSVRALKTVLANHATVSIHSITNLIPEFLYYILWADYLDDLMAKGYSFARAEALAASTETRMEAQSAYNLKLAAIAHTPAGEVVGNDLLFDDDRCVYILTGANRGGKTTITQAIGQLFVMAQGGIYVPGSGFRFVPVDGIFTHFPADEDKTMDFGRLGEECSRFRELFGSCTEHSLLLLNETFSTTSFEEGYYIAYDALRAILRKGVRTIYNTHMHKLAREVDALNADAPHRKAASLIVKSDGGQRSYKVEVAPAPGISYAGDIARKYGVTFEQLVGDLG